MAISKVTVSGRVEDKFKTQITCSHPFIIDQPKAAGGEDAGPNPLEIFLSSLPACICAIGKIIAKQKRMDVRAIEAKVEGSIDKDFLMGKTTEGRAGFTKLHVWVDIDADMTKEEKEAYVIEIHERCPIADNIAHETVMESVVE